jgi:putative transposase
VFEACYPKKEEKMAEDHRRPLEEMAQGLLLDDPGFLREVVERVLQELLEAEMTEHIGAAPYERAENRKGHRNGHKPRTLRTRVGTLNLLVPQDREGTFSTRLFSRYQRNEKALVLALMEMYLEGVSTRKVKDITEELCGTSFSKSTASHLATNLDAELRAWRGRPLEAKAYPYLFVDARYEKVRMGGRVVSQGVLIVSGVREDGFREILGVEVADTESEATYQGLFRSLKARGLSGVELVVSDDHEGLKAAVFRHFRGASWHSAARSTTPGTSSAWWAPPGARSWRRTCERSSPRRAGSKPSGSPPRWPGGGERKATRRSRSISKSMWRSA